jgi:hypothetical protein
MFRRHLYLISAVIAFALWPLAAAQTVTFTGEGVKYELELPSARWRAVPRLDVHDHVEFVYGGDRADGYLRVREYLVEAGTTPKDLFRREESRTLRFLPGYVGCAPCEGERFEGRLGGGVFAYEYASGGELMAGRVYYLEVNQRTFYSLHFTGESEKLRALKGQADLIAGSFRLK